MSMHYDKTDYVFTLKERKQNILNRVQRIEGINQSAS